MTLLYGERKGPPAVFGSLKKWQEEDKAAFWVLGHDHPLCYFNFLMLLRRYTHELFHSAKFRLFPHIKKFSVITFISGISVYFLSSFTSRKVARHGHQSSMFKDAYIEICSEFSARIFLLLYSSPEVIWTPPAYQKGGFPDDLRFFLVQFFLWRNSKNILRSLQKLNFSKSNIITVILLICFL